MLKELTGDFAQLLALHTDDLICVHEPDGTYLYLTPSSRDLLGYEPEELVGSTPYFLFHPDDVESFRSGAHALTLQGVTNVSITYRMRKKSGGYIWVETLSRPILDEAGNVLLVVTTSRDVTQRRLVEKQLTANEELLQTFFEQSLDACFFKLLPRPLNWQNVTERDAAIDYALFNLKITKVNDATCTLYRGGRERILGLSFGDFFQGDLGTGRRLLRALFDLGKFQTELHLKRLDGTEFWADCNFVCLYDDRGWIRGCFDVKKDITERKESRLKLEQAYAAVTDILESTTDGFFSVDHDWNITYLNRNFEINLGVKREDLLGKNLWEIFSDARGTLFESEYTRALATKVPVEFEEYYQGTQDWFWVRAYPTEKGLSIYFQKVTEKKLAEQKIENINNKLSQVLESTTDGFFALNFDWQFTYVNRNFEQSLNVAADAIVGKALWEVLPRVIGTPTMEYYRQALEERIPIAFEDQCPGVDRWFLVRGYPTDEGMAVYFQDITNRKLAEDNVKQVNRELTTVLESTTDGFFALNQDWQITYCNTKFLETVGLDQAQVLNHNLWDLFADARATPFEVGLRTALEEKVPTEIEAFYPGLGRWFYVKAYPVEPGLAIYFQDVTTRRIAEARLAEVNQELSTVLEKTTDAFISINGEGKLTYVNRNFEQQTGLSRGQLLGQSPWDVFPDLRNTAFFDSANLAMATQTPQKTEYFCSFTQTWNLAHIYPTPGGLSVYLQNITDRKRIESERQRRSELTELLLRLTIKVRESWETQEILQTTVDEVRAFLNVNRVIIYQFAPDWSGRVVVEAVDHPDYAILGRVIYDPCFGASQVGPYRLGRISQVANIFESEINPCYIEFLDQFQVQANLVVPITNQDELLGLLIAQHCQSPRIWEADEVDLLKQLSVQVGIAVNRATLIGQLRDQEARYRAIVEDQTELIYRCSPDGLLTFANEAFIRYLHGNRKTPFSGDCILDEPVQHPFDEVEMARFQQQMEALSPSFPVGTLECYLHTPQGDQAWYEWTIRALYDSNQELREYQCLGREVTRRKKIEFQLIHDALYDPLTGLPNRVLLMERLNQAWARYQRHPDRPFVLLFIDLDRFKRVNDSLGHQAGDQILMTMAERLRTILRATDTLARLSGDEFVLLAEEMSDGKALEHLIQRLQETATLPITVNENRINLTLSIGVAWSSEAYHQPDELLRDADIAMYQAKRRGRQQSLTFTPEMHLEAQFTLSLEGELRAALNQAQNCLDPSGSEGLRGLQVFYQPIVNLTSRTVIGLEALCRWFHPERGVIAPSEFIPLAEETGLMLPLGQWVLETAVAQSSQWYAELGGEHFPKLSVNLAPQQFLQRNLVRDVAAILEAHQLPPQYLHLEITESAMMTSLDVVVRVAQQLQDLGVFLNIDDFGTGYSSLSRLHQLPIRALKIDRSFVTRLDPTAQPLWGTLQPNSQQSSADIIQAMVSLGQSLQMEVIAEGVETEYQAQALRDLGCHYAQGYLFHAPLNHRQTAALLASQGAYPQVSP